MDLELSYLDPASYEPVFICNICNRVLTEPVCRNEHITPNFGPNPLDVDFENLIKSTVVRNSGGQPCTTETSSDSELKGKVCAIIPHPSKSQSPTHFLCPECGEITLDAKCRKDHNFQTMKDKCPVCDVECSSLESLIRHRKDCVPIEECFSNTTDLLSSVSLQNLGEDMYGIGQPAGMNLPDNFATMVQKGTLGTGQYQVTTGFVGDNDPIMDLLDTAMDGDLSLPLSDEIDGVLEWDDSMSLAVLDLDNVTSEISVFDDFLKTDMEMVEVSKPEIQSPPVIIEDKMPIQLPAETRKLLLCKKCGEEFPDMDTFVPHHILHGYSGRFECQFCSRRYTRLHWFRFHMETHADQLPVVCKFCDDYFLSTKLHDEHLQSVHDVDHDGMDKVLLSLEVIKNNPFLCMGCGRWLKSKKHLEMHHQMHALAKRKVAAADEPISTSMNSSSASADVSKPTVSSSKTGKKKPIHIFECNICSANIRSIDEVRLHLMSHSANHPYKCEACDERFPSTSQLQQHSCKRSVTISTSTYKCNECGKVFSQAAGLACHVKTHEDAASKKMETFSCDDCPEKFRVLSSYLIHRAKNH